MAARKRVQRLSLRLLQEGATTEVALREPGGYEQYELATDVPFQGQVCFRVGLRLPRWVPFVDTGLADRLSAVVSASTAAVLFVHASGRLFAYTFGHGHTMLVDSLVERDFGLRVALNAVDADRLRSTDVQTVEELTVHTRRQVSRGSPLETFGLDPSRDLMRAVTGQPRDPTLARRLTGSDALEFYAEVEFRDLGVKCEQLLDLYGQEEYKERFAWIDHLRPERDETVINELDQRLSQAAVGPKATQPHLAPPEPVDWAAVSGFRYPGESSDADPHDDLDLDDYLVQAEIDEVSADRLRTDRISVIDTESSLVVERWSVFECLVFETGFRDHTYVLTSGRWFRVDRDFAEDVRHQVAAVSTIDDLPAATKHEREGDYNARVAESGRALLLDCKLARAGPGEQPIEFCDLLSQACELIHVKKWSRSSTLSHLYAQGTVSAETFVSDRVFRIEARSRVHQLAPTAVDLVPEARPDPTRYTVVYAIIGKSAGSALPFFSQLALLQAVRRLEAMSFRVALAFVPIID